MSFTLYRVCFVVPANFHTDLTTVYDTKMFQNQQVDNPKLRPHLHDVGFTLARCIEFTLIAIETSSGVYASTSAAKFGPNLRLHLHE